MTNQDDEFNEREMARSFAADRDRQPAMLTRRQVRELEDLLEERRMRKRATRMISTFAKWIVAVGAAVTLVQAGWSNVVKWLAVR